MKIKYCSTKSKSNKLKMKSSENTFSEIFQVLNYRVRFSLKCFKKQENILYNYNSIFCIIILNQRFGSITLI